MQASKENNDDIYPTIERVVDKIAAYSDIGFVNKQSVAACCMGSLDKAKEWYAIPRQVRDVCRENGQLTFGDALQAMRQGYRVSRNQWQGIGKSAMYLHTLSDGSMCFLHEASVRYRTVVKELDPDDVLAQDWTVIGYKEIK